MLFISKYLFGSDNALPTPNLYTIPVLDLEQQEYDLTKLKGNVVLFVNVASKCGFTGQYKGLQSLYSKYKDAGLTVIGIPSNDFGNQEPGSNKDIASFCQINYGVSFPILTKMQVKGAKQSELYNFLTHPRWFKGKRKQVSWNFNKFLVDQNGNVVAHFGSFTKPLSKSITKKIDALLSNNQ